MKTLTVLSFVFLVFCFGCSSNDETILKAEATATATTTPELIPTKTSELRVIPPPPTKGHFRHFGFSGSLFRIMKAGEITGLEGGLLAVCARDGQMWAIDTEPNDNYYTPLEERKIYLAKISGELVSKHCGIWLPEYAKVPDECIEGEAILSWRDTKTFLLGRLSKNGPGEIAVLENFLRERTSKK